MPRSRIPLRIRLSLGSALRLSLAIAAFGVIAYQTTKRAALDAAEGRVRAAVWGLADRSSLGLREVVRSLAEAAADTAVIRALRTGQPSPGALTALERLPADSPATIAVGLRTVEGRSVLSLRDTVPSWAFDESLPIDSAGFGRAMVRGDSIYYEASAPVFDRGKPIGSVVRLRRLVVTPAGIQTVSTLIGGNGALLFGNTDGTLWTDLTRAVPGPPGLDATRYHKNGREFIVASRAIPGTPFTFAVEMPVTAVLAPMRGLVRDFAIVALILVGLGLIAGYWANERITRPLTDLTRAAEAITAGDQPRPAPELEGRDELGRLQHSFQTMTESVWQAREDLKQQVAEQQQALEALRISEERLSAERARLEETLQDLRESEEALRLADRRKDEFLAMLAHELRNPLAPIRNAAQIFRLKSPADPDLQRSRDVIDRQVTQMSRLLDDLLDVSRISHNRLELRPQRVDLRQVLHTSVETSRPFIDGARHQLTLILPPGPVELEADPVRLAQVFSNLLNNSAKYTLGPGHIRVMVEPGEREVTVTVSDDGIGIAPESLPNIFDRFTSVRPALGQSNGGLGIGLSLVQGLVALHGGRVKAASEGPGRGSRFTVWLPLAPVRTAAPAGENRTNDHSVATTGRRVLVADDLADSAESLALLLGMLGHEVWIARDGQEAVALAAEHRPGIILLDLGMPKVDGYEACRRIREQSWGSDVIIVALTGWGQEEDRRRTGEAGFDHHLVKPVEVSALIKLFESAPVS